MTDGVTGWPPGVGTDVVNVVTGFVAVGALVGCEGIGGAVARTTEPTSTTVDPAGTCASG